MIPVDFHAHTHFSQCGIHSHIEMLEEAKRRGMAALAITDHGPALKGRHPSPAYERLHDPVPGIRYLKGIEANVVDEQGTIDVPAQMLPWMDVVLLGLHVHFERPDTSKDWTASLVAAMQKNPCVDIITHPLNSMFPVDLRIVAETACELGIALELNNSKLAYQRVTQEETVRFLAICREAGCRMVLASDAHAIHEVGEDALARPLLEQSGISEELIVNASAERAFAFIESRRSRKTDRSP